MLFIQALKNRGDFLGNPQTLVKLLTKEHGSCLDALFAEVGPRYAKGTPFVLANCPYLYWWTNAEGARKGQAAELRLYQDANPKFDPDVAGATKVCFHCKKAFPKGDILPGQNVTTKNAKLCIFWTTAMWKNRSKKNNLQCHLCRHKAIMKDCKVT